MKADNLTIIPPEGMEAYQEGNEIKFRPIKEVLTYEDISKKLFFEKTTYYITTDGEILDTLLINSNLCELATNCVSEKQAQKLLAINKLMNVAKYLNGDWQPDWSNSTENKFYIYINRETDTVYIASTYNFGCSGIYFKLRKLAEQAIKILGEKTIKLALSTDW